MPIDDLTGQFIVLTTYRRSGEAVPTTVWFARMGDVIIAPTGASTGKVKRLRNDPAVAMVRSNYRGKLKGEPVTGNARILEGDDAHRARAALKKKYGIQWRFGGSNIDTILEITPT